MDRIILSMAVQTFLFKSVLKTENYTEAEEQPPEREISYICGLGAKVGCEWLSEHSTCSDESHKYSLFLFLEASPLLHKSKFFLYFLKNRVRIKSYMFKYMMTSNLEVINS